MRFRQCTALSRADRRITTVAEFGNCPFSAGFSAAVVPYLHALGMKDQEKQQMDRLAATKDKGSGLYGHGGDYYDQNLAMFATGWGEHRFQFEADGRLRVKWKA